jgi:hypothetical protein
VTGTFGLGASGGSPPPAEIVIKRRNGEVYTVLVEAARETQAARLRLFPFTNEARHPVPAA